MPPRLVTGAIIAFWLAMTGWLIQREVVPMLMADVSSAYEVDLTDQIQLGAAPVETPWTVYREGKRIGMGKSKVISHGNDNTYEFRSVFHFDEFRVGIIKVRGMENTYHVTDDSKLIEVTSRIHADLIGTVELSGKVAQRKFHPKLRVNELDDLIKIDPVDLSRSDKIINPMHLLNRLRGLHTRQTWSIPLLDPLRSVNDAGKMSIPELIAIVESDTLTWEKKEVVCHKIEYRKRGEDEVMARTWVRKSDGLVLQQDANYGFNLVMRRGLE